MPQLTKPRPDLGSAKPVDGTKHELSAYSNRAYIGTVMLKIDLGKARDEGIPLEPGRVRELLPYLEMYNVVLVLIGFPEFLHYPELGASSWTEEQWRDFRIQVEASFLFSDRRKAIFAEAMSYPGYERLVLLEAL